MTPTRPITPAEVAQGMAHVSLFSGVGGFELAMQQAGIPTIAACEIDKAARGVLADHFPDTHIYHDVKGVTGDSLRSLGADPGRTVLTAGWPCQGNSVAGRRGGMADERSGLWAEVARILAEFRPAWFVGENVPGLLSVAGGWDYATVLGDMARLGYGFAWRVLDSRHFGVPQRRRRIVLVGHLGDDGRAPAQVLLEPEGGGRNPAEGITPRPVFAPDAGGRADGRRVPTLTARCGVCAIGATTHALTAEGADASEDGTGRGTPIITVPVAATLTAGQHGEGVSAPGRRQEDDYNLVAMAFAGQAAGDVYLNLTEQAPTLGVTQVHSVLYAAERTVALDTAQGGPDDNSAQGGHLVAFALRGRDDGALPEIHGDGHTVGALRAADGGSSRDYVAFHENQRGELTVSDVAHTLKTGGGKPGQGYPAAMIGTTVRRLTPLECERLQGYPDGWTLTSNGKPQADSARYKQLGNSIAVPVFVWVAKRLAAVASSCHGTGAAA